MGRKIGRAHARTPRPPLSPYTTLFQSRKPVAGIKNAQALAMIGNARRGSSPSRLSRISDGAEDWKSARPNPQTSTLPLHDALPISKAGGGHQKRAGAGHDRKRQARIEPEQAEQNKRWRV